MAVSPLTQRQDEVLGRALDTDVERVPRYNIKDADGNTIADNATVDLANPIETEGMPYNADVANQMLSAAGRTGGTGNNFAINQPGYELKEGQPILLQFDRQPLKDNAATLRITGGIDFVLKPLINASGDSPAEYITDSWGCAIYSSELDAFIMQSGTTSGMKTWQFHQEITDIGVGTWVSPFTGRIGVVVMGGGGGGGSGSSGGSGGGGGGYVTIRIMEVTTGQAISYLIGYGGAPNTNGGSSGFNGFSAQGGYRYGRASDGSISNIGGGAGGSGGGGGGGASNNGGLGGSAGANGQAEQSGISPTSAQRMGGRGQGLIICPFDTALVLSAGGNGENNKEPPIGYKGNGGYSSGSSAPGNATGYGNGGCGGSSVTAGSGSQGIVILYREVPA